MSHARRWGETRKDQRRRFELIRRQLAADPTIDNTKPKQDAMHTRRVARKTLMKRIARRLPLLDQETISKHFQHIVAQILDSAGDDNTWTGVRLRRAWFRGTELVGILADWVFDGDHIHEDRSVTPLSLQCAVASIGPSMDQAVGPELVGMIRSLGLGVLAAITTQPARKSGQWGITKKRPGKKKPERIQLGEVWDVAAPVTIDLRDHVRSIQLGKTKPRAAPTAAWVVRGHWRNQVHGPGRTLRRQTWIEPYWKGEESMRRLMRGVEVKE